MEKRGRPKKTYAPDPWETISDPQWEQFAHCIASGLSQRQAAIDSGYSPKGAQVQGVRLAKKPTIRARIDYLRDKSSEMALESVALTKTEILRKLAENSASAAKTGDYSAVNRALELIGKQLGMFVERKVIGLQALIAEMTPDNLRLASPEELLRLVGTIETTLALPPGEDG